MYVIKVDSAFSSIFSKKMFPKKLHSKIYKLTKISFAEKHHLVVFKEEFSYEQLSRLSETLLSRILQKA